MWALTPPTGRLDNGGVLDGVGSLSRSGGLNGPASNRWLAAVLIAGVLLVPLGIAVHEATRPPRDLHEAVLVGVPPPEPTNLVVVLDVSGSMAAFAGSREQALREIVAWAQRNMRSDDTLAVFAFDSGSQGLLAPTQVQRLGEGFDLAAVQLANPGTEVGAIAGALARDLPDTPQTIVWITDTRIDVVDPERVRTDMKRANVVSATTIIPPGQAATTQWVGLFPYSHTEVARPDDADEIGVDIARAVAHSTGQRVERGAQPSTSGP